MNDINYIDGAILLLCGLFLIIGIYVGYIITYDVPDIKQSLCKQLYTITEDYISCNQGNHTLDEIIGRVQSIK